MNSSQQNRFSAYLAVQATLNTHADAFNSLAAFVAGAEELDENISSIRALVQTQIGRNAAATEKSLALQVLNDAAYEVAAATFACAVASGNKVLATRLDYSRSDISRGRGTSVVARCKDIHAAASGVLDSLAGYGVNASKLTALKKKVDAFEAVQSKPRHGTATASAATKELRQLFTATDELLSKRLDRLAVQFKASQPAFYNEYKSARSIVQSGSGRSAKEVVIVAVPSTAPAVAKAA